MGGERESNIPHTCDIKNVFDVLLKLEIKFRSRRHIKYDMWKVIMQRGREGKRKGVWYGREYTCFVSCSGNGSGILCL